jgi:hypothetical protein
MLITLRNLALVVLPLATGCATYRAPQATSIPTCADPARPCDRTGDNFGWAQESLRLSVR